MIEGIRNKLHLRVVAPSPDAFVRHTLRATTPDQYTGRRDVVVSAYPTYHGIEFTAAAERGLIQRIGYPEHNPNARLDTHRAAIAHAQRVTEEESSATATRANQYAQKNHRKGLFGRLLGLPQQIALDAQTRQDIEKYLGVLDLPAWRTFQQRRIRLQELFMQRDPNARVTIYWASSNTQPIMEKLADQFPTIQGWNEPKPRHFPRLRRDRY